MTRKRWLCLIAVILLANAGATCLLSTTSPELDIQRESSPWSRIVAAAVGASRWPIRTADSSDIRDIMLLVGLGLACLVVGIGADGTRLGGATPPLRGAAPSLPGAALRSAEAWLWFATAGVIVLSLTSMAVNRSAALSWGWMVRFACGAGWAILLARTVSTSRARQVVLGLLGVAGAAMLFGLAHRADRGYEHFQWPIGPITVTGALAAAWAAMAGALAVGRRAGRSVWLHRVFAGLVCILAAYVLQQTGRRAPAVGFAFAILVTGLLLARTVLKRRTANLLVVAAFVAAIAGAGYYTVAQSRSSRVEVAGPVTIRFEYWRLSTQLIAEAPLLGHGPDLFVAKMTSLMAPLRAYSPHVYHGNIDPHAHNEWLQAAVELGVPGAILYLALPLGVIVHGVRRLDRLGRGMSAGRDPPAGDADRGVILSMIAGLAAIVVLDAASITLRGPIMPIWYWTLLGLLASASRGSPMAASRPATADNHHGRAKQGRGGEHQRARADEAPPPTPFPSRRAALISVGVISLGFAAVDLEHSRAACEHEVVPSSAALVRLWADKTLPAWRENAVRALEAAMSRPGAENLEVAEALTEEVYAWWPGSPEAPAAYADALLRGDKRSEGARVLEEALSSRWDPFNRVANILYAERVATAPAEKLTCVRRAIRSSRLDELLRAIALQALASPDASAAMEQELLEVRRIAAGEPGESAREALVELLRISAAAKEQAGRLPEAITDQRLAAEFYRRLEQEHHPYRRRSDVETDAFLTLARMLYAANHADYQAAYEAIIAAERYAILGIRHASLAKPQPEDGFVGGEVVPTEYPEDLRPMWQLSSLLHILVGREQQLMARVFAGLPQDQWNDTAVRRELVRLYRQAAADMTGLPAAQRPEHYRYILEMAGQMGPAAGR